MPSLDPKTWETPKEEFVGVIRVACYSNTDASKTKDGETFTEFFNLPRPIPTFRLVVQRLDAVYKNKETGETSPLLRFQDLQLERFDERKKVIVPVTQGDNKNTYILTKFAESRVKLVPSPEAVQGAVCRFVREGTHRFGGNMAKNLLYPVKLLGWMDLDELKMENGTVYPAVESLSVEGHMEFEYAGDVEEIEFDPNRDDDSGSSSGGSSTSLDQAAAASNEANKSDKGEKAPAGKKASSQMSEDEIMALFVGKTVDDEDAATDIISENKSAIPQTMKASLVSGEALEGWLKEGKLVVVDDEYALPEAE